jgi:dTDP-4-dehydrorhamnose reductase
VKVAVTGSGGQLGWELCRRLAGRAAPLDVPEFDLTCTESVDRAIDRLRPDVLINCAAYTNVDGAEKDEPTCYAVNVEGLRRVAAACQRVGARLVQISTDYVFCGSNHPGRPFREDDPPRPRGVYASSKWESERIAAELVDSLTVRTCGLYASRADDSVRNFPKTMLRLAAQHPTVRVVDDQHCTPSYVPHVARAILFLVERGQRGRFHIVNGGATTWCGFARELFRQAGLPTRVQAITSAEYPAAAPRPPYSVLDPGKYASLGGPALPRWQDGITAFLRDAS